MAPPVLPLLLLPLCCVASEDRCDAGEPCSGAAAEPEPPDTPSEAGTALAGTVLGYLLQFSLFGLYLLSLVIAVAGGYAYAARKHALAARRERGAKLRGLREARPPDVPPSVLEIRELRERFAAAIANVDGGEESQWLTALTAVLWPCLESFVEKTLIDTVEPLVRSSLPTSFRFTSKSLGRQHPVLGPVVHSRVEGGLELAIGFIYCSDCDIRMQAGLMSAGVSDFSLVGTLGIVLRPLIAAVPFLGGCEIMFINTPEVEMDFKGLANVADVPGLHEKITASLAEAIGGFCALPHRIAIPFAFGNPDVDPAELGYPKPAGILRVTVVRGRGLRGSDNFGRSSDPYVQVRVGKQCFRTSVQRCTLDPEWPAEEATFDLTIYSLQQWIHFEVLDMDRVGAHDSLGHIKYSTVRDVRRKCAGAGCELEVEKGTGTLTVQAHWRTLVPSADAGTSSRPSSALLCVNVQEVAGLPAVGETLPLTVRLSVAVPKDLKLSEWSERCQPLGPSQVSVPGWPRWDAYPDDAANAIRERLESEVARTGDGGQVLWRDGLSTTQVALRLNLDEAVVKLWLEARRKNSWEQWNKAAVECRERRKQMSNPRFEQVLMALLPHRWDTFTLTLLSGPKARPLAACRIGAEAFRPTGTVRVCSYSGDGGRVKDHVFQCPEETGAPFAASVSLPLDDMRHENGDPCKAVQLRLSAQLHVHVETRVDDHNDSPIQRRASAEQCQECGERFSAARTRARCTECRSYVCKPCSRACAAQRQFSPPYSLESTTQSPKSRLCRGCHSGTNLPPETARLAVDVIEAKGLMRADLGPGQKSDPYVTVRYAGKLRETKVKSRTLDPQWQETFCFKYEQGSPLTLFVWDSDMFNAPDPLGTVTFRPEALCNSGRSHGDPARSLSGCAEGAGWLGLCAPEADRKLRNRKLGEISVRVRVLERGEAHHPPSLAAADLAASSAVANGVPLLSVSVCEVVGSMMSLAEAEVTMRYAGRVLDAVPGNELQFEAQFVPGGYLEVEMTFRKRLCDAVMCTAIVDPILCTGSEDFPLRKQESPPRVRGGRQMSTFASERAIARVRLLADFIDPLQPRVAASMRSPGSSESGSTASSAKPLCSGHLEKQARGGGWGKRWFRVSRGFLVYSASQDRRIRKTINIDNAVVERAPDVGKAHCLRVTGPRTGRIFVLAAKDDRERDLWVAALRASTCGS